MSVITASKDYDELCAQLIRNDSLTTLVIGCDKCAKTSKTGGSEEVRALRDRLRLSGIEIPNVPGLVDAVEEGLCDTQAVNERLKPLAGMREDFQVLVLSCGAGLKCVRDALPGKRIVPGLDTLGPGVKADLACLACGDCRFGEDGCSQLRRLMEQVHRLGKSYS